MKGDLINEFVDEKVLKSLDTFLKSEKDNELVKSAVEVADVFGAGDAFKSIANDEKDSESKLVTSFHNNLVLLIQKTWVEKSDEAMKAQVLYQLEELCKQLNAKAYNECFEQFFNIVDDVVYLMFGNQTKTKDFCDYALRIDPEFGIFWWYMKSLPRDAEWAQEKTRIAILLGMYFLANY